MKTFVLVPPEKEPITLLETKTFLKISHGQEDGLIQELITAARTMVETETRRKLINQQLASILPFYPHHKKEGLQRVWSVGRNRCAVFLPRGPVQRVVGVDLISDEGDATPLTPRKFHVNLHRDPSLMVVDETYGWGIRVTYDVGYGPNPKDVPAPLRQALLQMVSTLYHHRGILEARLLKEVRALVGPYTLMAGAL